MYFWISSEAEKKAEPESALLTEDLCTKFLFKIYFSRDVFLQGSAEPGEDRLLYRETGQLLFYRFLSDYFPA